MKREIKFRGKAKENDIWLYGNIQIPSKENVGYFMWGGKYHLQYEVFPETIGQFTGLIDKNGTEIYEGDIMGLPERDAEGVAYKNRYIRVVEWINDGFFLLDNIVMGDEVRKYGDRLALEISLNSNYAGIARCFKERGLDYTVIGNIHDNPELLEGGAK